MTTPFFRTFIEIFNRLPSVDGLVLDDEESLTFKIEGLGRITIGWMEETDNYIFSLGVDNISIYHGGDDSSHLLFDIDQEGDAFMRDNSNWVRLRMSRGSASSSISNGPVPKAFFPLKILVDMIINTHRQIAGDILKWVGDV